MQPSSLLLVLLGLTLTQGKQQILEKQGDRYYAPVANTPERKCPRFQYFDCKECVPMRNSDNGPLCACEGWVYDDFMKECRPSSSPPTKCEANLKQCQNEMQRVQQELQNCRQHCWQKPSQPPPQQPGIFEYDRDGDYRCKFTEGGYPGPPCRGALRSDFRFSPEGRAFTQPNQRGYFPPAEIFITGPAVLEVSDNLCRVAQYEVRINGQSLGRTSNAIYDNSCQTHTNSYCWSRLDQCIRHGFSHGLFQIPFGFQKVQIHWVNGILHQPDNSLWASNWGLYRVFDVCPGQV